MQRYLFGMLGLLLLAGIGLAAPGVEADPNKEYPIVPEAGPWLICAASFKEANAAQLARELVLVMRHDYQMPAYIFIKGRKEREEQRARLRDLRAKCPEGNFRMERIEEQFAVLVGGYKDNDSARRALDDFRKLPVPPAKFCTEGVIQTQGEKDGTKGVWIKQVRYSPFTTSFVAHNPTVELKTERDPHEDEFLRKINAGESLSLLEVKKKWTLAVKSFQGAQSMQQPSASAPGTSNKFLDMLGLGSKPGEQLNAGAMQAHELAKLLRSMKPISFEAYVLHTRTSSIVTVGGYDAQDDPKLIQDQQMLSKLKLQAANPSANMQLFTQPLPMEVPHPKD